MIRSSKLFLLATVAAVSLPALASAASILIENPVSAGGFYTFSQTFTPNEQLEYRFTALTNVWVDSFSVSGTGNNAADDIEQIRFGRTSPPTQAFTTVDVDGTASAGFGFIDGGKWAKDSVFSIFFTDGIDNDVSLTLSFSTAAVPLPATGLLLAPFLLAGGVAGYRRRKAAHLAS